MTLDQLGSLGEVVGAVATLATLLYLAAQIRQNTTAVRSSSAAAYVQNINQISNLLGADPELCELYYRGLEQPSALSESERRRFFIVLGSYLIHLMQADQMESAGTLAHDLTLNSSAQIEWMASQPGYLAWQEAWGDTLPQAFREKLRQAAVRGTAAGRLGVFAAYPGGSKRAPNATNA